MSACDRRFGLDKNARDDGAALRVLSAAALLDDDAAEKRPFGLFAIKAGNQLVGLLVMGPILGAWQ